LTAILSRTALGEALERLAVFGEVSVSPITHPAGKAETLVSLRLGAFA